MERIIKRGGVFAAILSLGTVPSGPPVSYECPGKSLALICKDLSQFSPQPLKVSQELQGEVFAISVSRVDLEFLKKEIATVERAEWVQEGNGLLLQQSSKQKRQDERQHLQDLKTAYKAFLDQEAKRISGQPQFTSQRAAQYAQHVEQTLESFGASDAYARNLNALQQESPSYRAMDRIAQCFAPEELAALPVRVRKTYANDPNAVQRALPEAATSAVERFIADQTLWANAAKSHRFESVNRGGASYSLPTFLSDQSLPTGQPGKILVGLYRESENGRIRVDLKVASTDGRLLCRASSVIRPVFERTPVSGAGPADLAKPLQLDSAALQMSADGYRRYPLNSDVRFAILDPKQTDPLAIAYGNTLVRLAKTEGVNLVANLADQMVDGASDGNVHLSSRTYLDRLASRGQESQIEAGWLTVAPRDLDFARTSRADRRTLESYLQASVSRSFSVEAQAAAAVALPDPMDNPLPSELVSRLRNEIMSFRNVALLRFYGSLGQRSVDQARSSAGLPLWNLPAESRTYLDQIIYGELGFLNVSGTGNQSLFSDPTECLARGIHPEARLYLTVNGANAIFDLNRDHGQVHMNESAVGAGELAFAQYQSLHPEKYPDLPNGGLDLKTPHFALGELTRYDFNFSLAPSVSTNGTLQGRSLNGDAPVRLDELPVSFLGEMSQQLAQIERDEKKFGSNGSQSSATSANP